MNRLCKSEHGYNSGNSYVVYTNCSVPVERDSPIRAPRGNKPVKLMGHCDEFLSTGTRQSYRDKSDAVSLSNYDNELLNEFDCDDRPRAVPNSSRSLWS